MPTPKKILIVDDSAFERNILVRGLTSRGFEAIAAENAASCLQILEKETVDLVLMDILMPDMEGTEALKKIREKKNAIELPVIMITAKNDVADVVHCLQSGANDYISKPLHVEVVLSRAVAHMKLAEISKEMGKLQEVQALHALVVTYNHEIRNPLAIAIASLQSLEPEKHGDKNLKRIDEALWRISDIVKEIQNVVKDDRIVYTQYSGETRMLKVK